MQSTTTLVFIVPVKSAKVSGNWDGFTKLFERTVKSICNQTSSKYEVIVSCHEIPQITYRNEKIHYHQVDFDVPQLQGLDHEVQVSRKESDKAKKIQTGIVKAQEFKPSYIMVVDSDDCISNKIVEFVSNDKTDCLGWYFKKGFFYQEGKPYAFLNKSNFNQFCGSGIIIKSEFVEDLFLKEPSLYYDHFTMVLPNGQALTPLPFPGAVYSMANGENHYMSSGRISNIAKKPNSSYLNFIKSIISKLKKYRPTFISGNFKKAFNLYKI